MCDAGHTTPAPFPAAAVDIVAARMSHSAFDPIELDQRHLWHPFTPQLDWCAGDQPVIERAMGTDLVDADGVLKMLGVYNATLPPLPEIVRTWKLPEP